MKTQGTVGLLVWCLVLFVVWLYADMTLRAAMALNDEYAKELAACRLRGGG